MPMRAKSEHATRKRLPKSVWQALGRLAGGIVDDIRLAVGSVAPIPIRLSETEQIVKGRSDRFSSHPIGENSSSRGSPADRRHSLHFALSRGCSRQIWSRNFWSSWAPRTRRAKTSQDRCSRDGMALQPDKAAEEILPCCGSKAWALEMAARRPLLDESALLAAC